MLGLGGNCVEVLQVLDDLMAQGCDILTLGQYLRPSGRHFPEAEYIFPEVFKKYAATAFEMGFSSVSAGPFVRSSYRAKEQYEKACESI